jgi:hypothetical protein
MYNALIREKGRRGEESGEEGGRERVEWSRV